MPLHKKKFNKHIYIYIYILLCIAVGVSFCALGELGKHTREGYIETIVIDADKTLELNNDKRRTKDFKWPWRANAYAGEFSKQQIYFMLKTNSFLFKRSDIYSIHPDFSKISGVLDFDPNIGRGNMIIDKNIALPTIPFTLKLKTKIIRDTIIFLIALPLCFVLARYKVHVFFVSFIGYIIMYLCRRCFYINSKGNEVLLTHAMQVAIKNAFSINIVNVLFFLYMVFLAVFATSHNMLSIIGNDDWTYSSDSPVFYSPLDISGYFWQRGRHFGDALMSLSMRPLGEMLVSFGVDAFLAFKIVSSCFVVLWYFLVFYGFSILVWLLNSRRNFKMIFVIVSLFVISSAPSFYYYYVYYGAYLATAGVCLLSFLPILYYFLYRVELAFSNDKIMYFGLIIIFSYVASFQIEPSSLPIFALCSFILLYCICEYIKNKTKFSFFVFFYMAMLLIMIPTAFFWTLRSDRGRVQRELVDGSSIIDNMLHLFSDLGNKDASIWFLLTMSVIILCAIVYHAYKTKRFSKNHYIPFCMVIIGIVGIVGFFGIRVPNVWFELSFIFLGLITIAFQLRNHSNKVISAISCFVILGSILCLGFKSVRVYENYFNKYFYYRDSVDNLIKLYQEADKNDQDELIVTDDVIKKNKLEIFGLNDSDFQPNSIMSVWMHQYGYTNRYIKIKLKGRDERF